MPKELPSILTIDWLRTAYARREWTPDEVVRAIVRRAEKDGDFRVWITPPHYDAIRPYLDRLSAMDPAACPLWGVPFAVKDNIDWSGITTTAGCPDFAYVPEANAAAVERLLAAGAIPLGKTNLDQFATGLVGTRSPYGEARNALRPELISGGSSSGSAVAVARGHAAFALGTDTAGSGRVPAALNGIVGWKPSLGAWPVRGIVPACASLDCVTVFACRLGDALAVDRAVRGPDPLDPWSKAAPPLSPRPPMRILVPDIRLAFFGPFAEPYEEAWNRSLDRLAARGFELVPTNIQPLLEAAEMLYEGPFVEERWAGLGDFVESHPGSLLPVTEKVLRSGATRGFGAASAFRAMHLLQARKLEVGRMLRDAALALPTVGGTWTREDVRADPIGTNSRLGMYTNHCNLLNLCAAAVPAGEALEGLPFGLSFFSVSGREDLAFGAAAAFLGEDLGAEPVPVSSGTTLVAVCGLHMRGFPLERQMEACGARFVKEARTSSQYRMYELPTTPAKPGLVKRPGEGSPLRLEVWEMPLASFGPFVAAIPSPLGIGKVELEDGTEVPGFLCESYAAAGASDITARGGWKPERQAKRCD
ncbi:allophanate hydrolase [Cohnella caldifontis]|uniref:allophanate hydrolase n=1 Tax=Cohnella caldifontis TaxID=3027471 RepID=UPI0023EC0CA6|nr:allophanate hydrolase [Cohnella sp. YIM B05605]